MTRHSKGGLDDYPIRPTRLRSERRSSLGPLREVMASHAVRLGRGHAVQLTLECGHIVLHIGRRDVTVGSLTGCPHCK